MSGEINILIVDDEESICISCKRTLTREGYKVSYALNGEEALEKVASNKYDLIITDLRMPKIDGMHLLKTVKSKSPDVNVIMITGYGTISSSVEAIKLGAFDYVLKPYTAEELVAVVERGLGLTQLKRADEEPIVKPQDKFSKLVKDDLSKMWCIPDHSWVKFDKNVSATIGIDALYVRLLEGDITNLELIKQGTYIKQGEFCAKITVQRKSHSDSLNQHNLWSPVSGRIAEVNNELLSNLSIISKRPYDQGWFAKILLTNKENDLKNLLKFESSISGRVAKALKQGMPAT